MVWVPLKYWQKCPKKGIIISMFSTNSPEVLPPKKSFISDRLNYVSLGVALLINSIHWAVLLFKIKPGENSILLHYNVIYGPDLVDKANYAYLVPLIALIIFIVNLLIALYFYRKEKLGAYFLNFAGIPIQLIFLAASLVLISAND
jgi:hypothetical protein